jgi:hypothetical protein
MTLTPKREAEIRARILKLPVDFKVERELLAALDSTRNALAESHAWVANLLTQRDGLDKVILELRAALDEATG